MKSYFVLPDNILDKKVMNFIDSKSFSKASEVYELINDFTDFYARHFFDGKLISRILIINHELNIESLLYILIIRWSINYKYVFIGVYL